MRLISILKIIFKVTLFLTIPCIYMIHSDHTHSQHSSSSTTTNLPSSQQTLLPLSYLFVFIFVLWLTESDQGHPHGDGRMDNPLVALLLKIIIAWLLVKEEIIVSSNRDNNTVSRNPLPITPPEWKGTMSPNATLQGDCPSFVQGLCRQPQLCEFRVWCHAQKTSYHIPLAHHQIYTSFLFPFCDEILFVV